MELESPSQDSGEDALDERIVVVYIMDFHLGANSVESDGCLTGGNLERSPVECRALDVAGSAFVVPLRIQSSGYCSVYSLDSCRQVTFSSENV